MIPTKTIPQINIFTVGNRLRVVVKDSYIPLRQRRFTIADETKISQILDAIGELDITGAIAADTTEKLTFWERWKRNVFNFTRRFSLLS